MDNTICQNKKIKTLSILFIDQTIYLNHNIYNNKGDSPRILVHIILFNYNEFIE